MFMSIENPQENKKIEGVEPPTRVGQEMGMPVRVEQAIFSAIFDAAGDAARKAGFSDEGGRAYLRAIIEQK